MILTLADDDGMEETIRRIAMERAYFKDNVDKYVLVETVEDVLRAKASDKMAVGFHFQGTGPVEKDLELVGVYYKLGVRHMLMAYNQRNYVGDGCHERTDAGLSKFGIQLVREMNRVGMIVDCAHSGYRTTMDVMEISESPVIFSHANASAVHKHPRNIRDEQIMACASTGGVIGINGISIFLGDSSSIENLIKHIDYYVQLVGVQHIGLGLDYVYDVETLQYYTSTKAEKWPTSGGYNRPDVEFFPPEGLPKLTDGLIKCGYVEADIRCILGENFLRVAQQVWK